MKFIDLFAGLGGFHIALNSLGHKCVFASEINEDLRKLYKINHSIDCTGDINAVEVKDIFKYDIISTGFPCQPFSKAGKQNGLEDSNNGNLDINYKILQFRPSGIRVKMPNFSLALVFTPTQIPIFPWLGRYMAPREASKLQCMEELKELPSTTAKAFRAFGNAVNSKTNYSVTPKGRAFRSYLFVRCSQKGFPLQSLTQIDINNIAA